MRKLASVLAACAMFGACLAAQGANRPPSPAGTAATQVKGTYTNPKGADGPVYQGGKWIEITYDRPIKRGRDLWGTGAEYGKQLLSGAPVWRAGANVSTRLRTETPLVINGKTVPAGEYSLFIDLKPNAWTLIVSSWGALQKPDANNKTGLWGSFGYTPDKDVVRAPMVLSTLPFSVDQLTWAFVDMTPAGGKLALMWDKVMAATAFKVQ